MYYLLQNDASGTIFNVEIVDGKVEKFSYAKDTIKDTQANYVAGKGSMEFCKLDPNAPLMSPVLLSMHLQRLQI